MTEPNGSRVTNSDLYRAIDQLEKLFRSELRRVEDRIGRVEDRLRERRGRWRAWGPPIIAALVAGGVSLGVALIFYP